MIVDILIAKMSSIIALAFSLSVLPTVLKTYLHGISKPPWGKSSEYCLAPMTKHVRPAPSSDKDRTNS